VCVTLFPRVLFILVVIRVDDFSLGLIPAKTCYARMQAYNLTSLICGSTRNGTLVGVFEQNLILAFYLASSSYLNLPIPGAFSMTYTYRWGRKK
jgi:hypothetical protein